MLYAVRMDVAIPHDLDPGQRQELISAEKALCHELQRAGEWVHIWRVAGAYSNISIFDVESGDELHQLLSSLPLFPYMQVEVTALTVHPSKLES